MWPDWRARSWDRERRKLFRIEILFSPLLLCRATSSEELTGQFRTWLILAAFTLMTDKADAVVVADGQCGQRHVELVAQDRRQGWWPGRGSVCSYRVSESESVRGGWWWQQSTGQCSAKPTSVTVRQARRQPARWSGQPVVIIVIILWLNVSS